MLPAQEGRPLRLGLAQACIHKVQHHMEHTEHVSIIQGSIPK